MDCSDVHLWESDGVYWVAVDKAEKTDATYFTRAELWKLYNLLLIEFAGEGSGH